MRSIDYCNTATLRKNRTYEECWKTKDIVVKDLRDWFGTTTNTLFHSSLERDTILNMIYIFKFLLYKKS